ncbi:sperm surface protein Sp17-like [Panonychus citri]|uniref:sperm surface protein Sp17-like n=1 Tax=Panonychus citri TaxID=50023 RepID=UPI002307F86F|nr:sperm surface protein Sp17-like [Panonychus citri]
MDIDLTDPELEKAATRIQATFKGYKVRKEVKEKTPENEEQPKEIQRSDSIDIDLNDPDVEKAATKIQATFRGYKSRREVKKD